MRDFTVNTCHSPCHLRRSVGETLRNNQTGKSLFWVWKDRAASRDVTPTALYVLPLWAATASLPFCLYPNTKSIHSWRFSDTCWLSSAVLFFWRKSLGSGQTRDTARGKQTTLRWAVEQLDQSKQEKKKAKTWSPRWKNDITNQASVLPSAQIQIQLVFQKAAVVAVKLRDQLRERIFLLLVNSCCSVKNWKMNDFISKTGLY